MITEAERLNDLSHTLDRVRIRLHGLQKNPTLDPGLTGPVSRLAEQADLLSARLDLFISAFMDYTEALDRVRGVGSE